ncbi:PLP-dependent aminotransferase family protein [Streptomyces sp. PSKA54]|uniref:PLP-dependent aminotransferase family protein n=1 Tax=Streptomyces himalayensis subsp. aureolus TaxID=2758039 RepID=A0A7W2CXR4_9ACTN|nr:PLP-dependent aminotransferase family protein [Streptomyces himalayensis]MBA4861049.1 PLP-dependent aminotransferase family protein [Streptomyces himalayensis subsp. aureolus]
MNDYRRIADLVAEDIASGRLRPGDRLPPQRAFARRRRIAPSTAGRVYAELVRRGLVVGEVGRGTFVRAAAPPSGRALAEPATAAPVNLELNYPVMDGQSELLGDALTPLLRPDVLADATRTAPAAGTPRAREAVAALLARECGGGRSGAWSPAPDRILFTGNARQAIAGALASLSRPGGRVGVESLTYPLVKEIAERLSVTLVPLASDEEGILPAALETAHRRAPLSALYVQPTLHNPTSLTTTGRRRQELADAVRRLGLPVVEDRIWSFLHADAPPPLAAYAPERTYVVDGLSKRVAPGLTVGFLVLPMPMPTAMPTAVQTPVPVPVPASAGAPGTGSGGSHVAATLRSGGWTASRFALEAAVRWIEDGVVDRLVAAKRADAARRQRLVAEHLDGFAVRADPYGYYVWWELPPPWRADTFTAAAAERGIAVTPGSAFAVGPGAAPDAVRLGLASAPPPDLAAALRTLAEAARHG